MSHLAPSTAAAAIDPYVQRFDSFEHGEIAGQPSWVLRARKSAISYFTELGFPTTQDEEWRFTNVAPIADLKPVFESVHAELQPADISRQLIPGLTGHRVVFVDGLFSPGLSSAESLPKGVKVTNLAGALAAGDAILQQHLARYARCDAHPFVALNTALFQDGLFVALPANCILAEPVHVLFITTGKRPGLTVMPRNLVFVGRNSQVRVIESYASLGDSVSFTNAVTELVTGENAILDHCMLQDESQSAFHIGMVEAQLARHAQFASHSISSGARITRNNIHLVMNGEGVHGLMNGLYLGRGDQVVDHHTVADHAQPHCSSFEFYHGILDGRSRGVFNGKIFVRKDAQKTDAKQTNRNLLLSDEATVDTKPQLEIFADDVKCTHGATVGQLDDQAVFYLRSRGIGLEAARQILVHAFASDVLSRIPHEPVRDQLEELLARRLDRPHGRDA